MGQRIDAAMSICAIDASVQKLRLRAHKPPGAGAHIAVYYMHVESLPVTA